MQGALRTKCTQIVHNDWCTVPVDRPSACCSGPAGSTNRGRGSLDKIYNNTVAIGLLSLQKMQLAYKTNVIFISILNFDKRIDYSKTMLTTNKISVYIYMKKNISSPTVLWIQIQGVFKIPDLQHCLFDFTLFWLNFKLTDHGLTLF